MPSDPEATRRALADGVRLFRSGRFFEAHEAWEEAWRLEQGETRALLQGLIQVAAGLHKGLVQGRPAGMVRLLAAGQAHLDAAGASGPVDLGPLRADLLRWRAAAERWAESGERPALPLPRIELR